MSIKSRSIQYGKVFDHWQIREWLGSGSNEKTAVFRLVHCNAGTIQSALKAVSLHERNGNYDGLSVERKAEYEHIKQRCKDNAEQEVLHMNALHGRTNIVDYLDHTFIDWVDEDGFGFDMLIRMELLHDLRSELENGRIFNQDEIIKIGTEVCSALVLCHNKDILHRDIKPDNIFFNDDGNYKLGDFGIARILSADPKAKASTGACTPAYRAPEQLSGSYDRRVDIYSLGLVLYELSNGNKLPFATSSFVEEYEVQMRILGKPLPAPCNASQSLASVILKACAFNCEDRYQTAEEFLEALNMLEKHIPVEIKKTPKCDSPFEYSNDPYATVLANDYVGPSKSENHFIFDSKRYLNEIGNDLYIKANQEYAQGNYVKSATLFYQAHVSGNSHASVRLGQMYWKGQGCEKDYQKAINLFSMSASYGNPLANEWLSEAYRTGKGVPKDLEKAKELSNLGQKGLSALCTFNDPDAMYMLGWNYINSPFYLKNESLGFLWLEKAAENGNPDAKIQVALCFINGIGCIRNVQTGIQALELLANSKNDASAHYRLGIIYYQGEVVNQDLDKARIHFEAAANQNHGEAQDYLGDIYYHGEGIAENYTKARMWYLKAFNNGIVNAAKNLGFIYYYGEGIDKNDLESFRFFKYAADKGDTRSQYMLHHFYLGMDQFINYQAGCDYLIQSAEGGDELAQTLLARLYIGGSFGLPESDEHFVHWIKKAAEQGHAIAEEILGQAYAEFNSPELPLDYEKAIYWLQRADEHGNIEATIRLAKYYLSGDYVAKDYHRATAYAQKAENALLNKSSEKADAIHWYTLAEYFAESGNKEKATDYYWKALQEGNDDALYHCGWHTLIDKIDSNYSTMTEYDLLDRICADAEKSDSPDLAFLLGSYYYSYPLKRRRYEEIVHWFSLASEKGSTSAMCKLAMIYCNELEDQTEAFSLAERAYKQGSAEGAWLLAMCYKQGIGTSKNKKKGKEILQIAAERGSESAAKELKKFFF